LHILDDLKHNRDELFKNKKKSCVTLIQTTQCDAEIIKCHSA